jgi:uridine kinase
MRIYILVSGLLRTFFDSLLPFLEGLINTNNNEIIILLATSNSITDENYMTYDYSLQLEKIKNIKEIKTILIDNFELNTNMLLSQREKNIIYQWYRINTLLQYLENYDINEEDIIIRLRTDIHFNINSDMFFLKLEKVKKYEGIFIPFGNDPNQISINDQIAFGKYKYMKEYCSLYKNINLLEYKKPLISEEILFNYLQNRNIKINRIDLSYTLRLSECKLIAISGDSGVGKTTLLSSIRKIFPFDKNLILEADRYHKWERTDENWKKITHLNPEANYLEKMLDDTFMLKMGEQVQQVDYDHSTGKFTDAQIIDSKQFIFLCGLHTLYNEEMRLISDLKIFIDTEKSLKKLWKIQRDMKKRGYTFEKCLEIFEKRQSDYEKFIFPQKKYADIIVNYYTPDSIPEYFDTNFVCDKVYMNLEISDTYLPFVQKFLQSFSYSVENHIFKIKNNIKKEDIINILPENYKNLIDIQQIEDSYLGILQAITILIFLNPT